MAFGGLNSNKSSFGTVSEINMVPLIDVMLVLLIIFIITAPLMAHSIVIDVPKASTEAIKEEPKKVDLAIDDSGNIFWDENPISMEELEAKMADISKEDPQPDLRIRADKDSRYEILAQIMAKAKLSGLKKLNFVTSPNANNEASEQKGANKAESSH
ncbi:ExbD/TolR family protein [Brackiella oedipodis]|uniref:ExbD/TolR family protein n=1 Tax=Brackiella oedipodis TaxID=124225 RepID=UPI00048E4B86|nr:biopolymer transporter ExbD [Brackiella oedipodis]